MAMMVLWASLLLHRTADPAVNAGSALYRATLIQAAPGKLLEVIDLVKAGWPGTRDSGDEPPLAMRHSQGDRWDLLLLFPMGTGAEYFSPDRIARRRRAASAAQADRERLAGDIAWQEDVFAAGPPLERVRGRLSDAGFFHVEMFVALAGRIPDLVREREMENAYSRTLGLPENLIFVRDSGAAWDVFTVGAYRSLKHYAESADIPASKQDEAAKSAGFESASRIGAYLRNFIREHHDTLAVAIRGERER